MGGRGGSSHRNSGGGGRSGRGQLAPWRDNDTALRQIMRDTGFTEAMARLAQANLIRFFGNDYDSFTAGNLSIETERISEAIMKMPYYNGGTIYRGIHLEDDKANQLFYNSWKPGTVQHFTDTLGSLKPIIQSFSNRESVAESFASWGSNSSGVTSIKFVLSGNKTAAGVQHISHFGTGESEVLSPSGQEFKVLRVDESISRRGGRQLTFYVEDVGRKKKK